jgi:hypothetical protein
MIRRRMMKRTDFIILPSMIPSLFVQKSILHR